MKGTPGSGCPPKPGVSKVGRAGVDVGFPLHLKGNNPERYGSLNHPGDSFSYDFFSQAAQALIGPANIEMLPGLSPKRLIAVGDSQSAYRLVTYVNGVDPFVQLFDGVLDPQPRRRQREPFAVASTRCCDP